jgi:hypothetical protein
VSDALKKVTRGESLADLIQRGEGPFNAAWFNESVDAIQDANRARRALDGAGAKFAPPPLDRDDYFLNSSGDDLDQYAIVGLGGLLDAPASAPGTLDDAEQLFRDQTNWNSAAPAPGQPFGITREPIPSLEIGRVLLTGKSKCRILVNNVNDRFAVPIAGNYTHLSSSPTGPAEILWPRPFGATGEQWAIVRLDDGLAMGNFFALSSGIITARLGSTLGTGWAYLLKSDATGVIGLASTTVVQVWNECDEIEDSFLLDLYRNPYDAKLMARARCFYTTSSGSGGCSALPAQVCFAFSSIVNPPGAEFCLIGFSFTLTRGADGEVSGTFVDPCNGWTYRAHTECTPTGRFMFFTVLSGPWVGTGYADTSFGYAPSGNFSYNGTEVWYQNFTGDNNPHGSQWTISAGPCAGGGNAPTINPNTADLCSDATSLVITGTNFTPTGNTVTLTDHGGANVANTVASSTPTSLTLTLTAPPIAHLGELDAVVSNANGTSSSTQVADVVDCSSIQFFALGDGDDDSTAATSFTLSGNPDVVDGAVIACVILTGGTATSATAMYGSTPMTLDKSQATAGGAALPGCVLWFSTPVTAGPTPNITATVTSGSAAITIAAMNVSAIAGTKDKDKTANGNASTPDGGTSAATTVANEIVIGAFVIVDGGDGTWQNGFTAADLDEGHTISGHTVSMPIGYKILSSTQTFRAQTTGGGSGDWAGGGVSYS